MPETVAGAERHRLHGAGALLIGLPTEAYAERWGTADLLARSRIGGLRTTWSSPFPGTDGGRMTIAGGLTPSVLRREVPCHEHEPCRPLGSGALVRAAA